MEIIERISDLLAERDKTAVELCKALDIQTSTMSTWKTRKKRSTGSLYASHRKFSLRLPRISSDWSRTPCYHRATCRSITEAFSNG